MQHHRSKGAVIGPAPHRSSSTEAHRLSSASCEKFGSTGEQNSHGVRDYRSHSSIVSEAHVLQLCKNLLVDFWLDLHLVIFMHKNGRNSLISSNIMQEHTSSGAAASVHS